MPIYARTSGGVYKAVSKILTADGSEIGKVVDSTGRIIYEASRLITVTGVPPISFTKSIGKPLVSWDLLGNAQQTGTPSPQNIVPFDGTGERTAQLWDESNLQIGGLDQSTGDEMVDINRRRSDFIAVKPSTTYTFIRPRTTTTSYFWVLKYRSDKTYIGVVGSVGSSATYVTGTGTAYIRWYTTQPNDYTHVMINEGSTALDYEPYGYKIPITNAGQTTPVYLGQTQTVRRVKKLVFDGTEEWRVTSGTFYLDSINPDYMRAAGEVTHMCSHFPASKQVSSAAYVETNTFAFGSSIYSQRAYCAYTGVSTAADFKSYLATQYAAGTPVTVWYVLAEPETAIVNEPLCKIGDHADELHSIDAAVTIPTANGNNTLTVDTDLPPSSMTIVYKGR